MFWILLIISFFWPPCWFAFGAYCLYLIFKSIIRHMGMRAYVNNTYLISTIRAMIEDGKNTKTLQGISMPSIELFAETHGSQVTIHPQLKTVTCLLDINAETYCIGLEHNGIDKVQISIMEARKYRAKIREKILEEK